MRYGKKDPYVMTIGGSCFVVSVNAVKPYFRRTNAPVWSERSAGFRTHLPGRMPR